MCDTPEEWFAAITCCADASKKNSALGIQNVHVGETKGDSVELPEYSRTRQLEAHSAYAVQLEPPGESSDDPDPDSLTKTIIRSSILIPDTLKRAESIRRSIYKYNENEKHEEHVIKHKIENWSAGLNLIKMMVGTGILFMPFAFRSSGLLVGIILMFCVSYFTSKVFDYMAAAGQHFAKIDGIRGHSYSSTIYRCLEESDFQQFAQPGRICANWLIALSQFSVSAIYVGLVSHNIQALFKYLFEWQVPLRICTTIQAPFLLAILSVKHLKYITPMSLIASVSLWIGVLITIYFTIVELAHLDEMQIGGLPSLENISKVVSTVDLVTDFRGVSSFFSIVVFAFGGVSGVLAVENNMKTPQHLSGCPSVICTVIFIVSVLYYVYGILGYVTFGQETKGPIFSNIKKGDTFDFSMNLFLAIGLFFAQPIVTYPALWMVWEILQPNETTEKFGYKFYICRFALIFIISIVPNLVITNLEALVGIFATVLILQQFLVPVLVDFLTWRDKRTGYKRILSNSLNLIFFVIGVFFTVAGIYYSIENVIKTYT